MDVTTTPRGFEQLVGADVRQSSAIGEYPDAMSRPGSSYLWINDGHCDRATVHTIVDGGPGLTNIAGEIFPHLAAWLKTSSLHLD